MKIFHMAKPPTVYTEADYIALATAIKHGAREVSYGDKKIKYDSLSEMRSALDWMAQKLGYDSNAGRTVVDFHNDI